jgi:hypothetical protein
VSRALVVDTSVARSAGGRNATHARSVACRDALEIMRKSRLSAVVSPALLDEYDRQEHISKFFVKWLAAMRSKGQIVTVDPPLHKGTRAAAQRHLPEHTHAAVEKDLHLVSAALAADRRVLSDDDAMRGYPTILAENLRALRAVHWANPEVAGCHDWLGRGAPDERSWMLGGE